jgi:phosphoribosylanthranilate isomerase
MTSAAFGEACTLSFVTFPFRIKVCGITAEEAARAALEAGADYLGLVLCPSPRRVTLDRAGGLAEATPGAWVGVFADSPLQEIVIAVRELGLAAVQLHGRESVAECRRVREAAGVPVWKAVRADGGPIDPDYDGAVDALLLDAGAGGTGRVLDWDGIGARFPRPLRSVPTFLAGGLGPGNVARAIGAARPDGVDASSRLERAPGVKDPDLVRAFVRRAREAARALDPVEIRR